MSLESVVFNYSNYDLSSDMECLLNRGLNFAVLPHKLDMTQILRCYKRFERTIIWKEFWFPDNFQLENQKKIFSKVKYNMPKNHAVPSSVKSFLSAIKSELMDPHNRNVVKCNLPSNEIKALNELLNLQKSKKIVIKQCDKGAGIMVLNYEEYKRTYFHSKSVLMDLIGPTMSKLRSLL